VGAAIGVVRVQMEANADEDKARGIALLKYEPNEGELDRATARLEEIEKAIRVVEKAVDDPKTDEAKLPALQAKLNNLRQEQLNLRRVLAKRA
jgi:phage-related minor tail protein